MSSSSGVPPENAKPSTSKDMSRGPLAVAKFLIGLFSTSTRQRAPPSPNKKTHVRLITISVSHFCEKVRWVLDHLEKKEDNPYYFTEDGHPPGFQAYETLKASDERASITPMIVWKDKDAKENSVLYDSVKIVKQFWPELYPKEIEREIDAMEADLGERLGSALRCYSYYEILTDVKTNHDFFVNMVANEACGVSKVERILTDKMLEKGFSKGIMKALSIDKPAADASLQAMRDIFAEISKRLENGAEYIMDDPTNNKRYGFTAADLTFAALAQIYVRPPQMQKWLMDEATMPKSIMELSNELRETAAGKHALKLYEKHRPVDDTTRIVTPKIAERNKYPWERVSETSWFVAASIFGIFSALIYSIAMKK